MSESAGYAVYTTRRTDKALEGLPAQDRERIEQDIYDLGDNPYPAGAIKLQGSSAYRIRRGDYRAIYEVDEAAMEVTVTKVAHRKDAYR